MRPGLTLLPLTIGLFLASAVPAMAADWGVDVTQNFEFTPPDQKIAVGDRVIWGFTGADHTTTSVSGQAERWDSGLRGVGASFEHTFTTPGRFQYVCTPHASFMKGTIVVGEDAETDTVDGFTTKGRRRGVTISFRLNEAARMTYVLRGPGRKRISRPRLRAGRHSFKVRRLKRGRYRATLTLVDDFDKKTTFRQPVMVR
jgi:plastocyanin